MIQPSPKRLFCAARLPNSLRRFSFRRFFLLLVSLRPTSLRRISLRRISLRRISLRRISLRRISLRTLSFRTLSFRALSLRALSLRRVSFRPISLKIRSLQISSLLSIALLTSFLSPTPVQAAEFSEGVGFMTLGGGVRFLPHSSIAKRAKKAGQTFDHSTIQGGGLLGLGYRIDESWGVLIEFSAGGDRVFLDHRRYDLLSVGLQASVNYSLPFGPEWLDPYLEAGIGYWLSTASQKQPESSSEDTVVGGMAGLGLRFALSDHFGLFTDFRWIWARQHVPTLGAATTGGGLLTVGIVYSFAPSEDDRFQGGSSSFF